MLKKIDGKIYIDLVNHGIKNIEKHRSVLNDLNVFPVPDGDTGTNMLMTLRHGYEATEQGAHLSLPDAARQFSASAVFGARGNSGVIVSQFFKGMAEAFQDATEADPFLLAEALRAGCRGAYAAVADPVEGTMLTVLKDASAAVTQALPLDSVEEVVSVFLGAARVSLRNTPELLPVLKKANVVDSGGSGIVYFFEGVEKYLRGEEIDLDREESVTVGVTAPALDLSLFHKDTAFLFGYCIEGLLQLRMSGTEFSHAAFKEGLSTLGESLVTSLEGDKLKLHVHSKAPGGIFNYCQGFGEFLTVHVENMTVQNTLQEKLERERQKFLYTDTPGSAEFAVVAVATSSVMQKKFFDMGADVVIASDIAPSSKDFMDAFHHTGAKQILVFPNSPNSILSSMQAGSLYKGARVTVLNSRSISECYAALSVMDFDGSMDDAAAQANDTIANIRQVTLYRAANDVRYGTRTIAKNDFFALRDKSILAVDRSLERVALQTAEQLQAEDEAAVITLFYGRNVPCEYAEHLAESIAEADGFAEVATVSTMDTVYDITMTFE